VIQFALFGIPVVPFAESYMAFLERLLRSRNDETKYGIEQMATRKIASEKYLNISHLVATLNHV